MGRLVRGCVALAAGASFVSFAVPAYAAAAPAYAGPTPPARGTVGGPLLAGDGIVVHDTASAGALPKVSASSYVIADLETGQVLGAKDPHGRYRPASTLKILTAITLIPRLDPDDTIKPTQDDCNVEGTKVGITPKLRYPVDDLFRGLLMTSGNDAALALARGAGGLDRTLELMNATSRQLRAYDTVAKTPHGLDRKGQLSSAYDLALLTAYGLGMPEFREYVREIQVKFPAPKDKSFQIATHNRLLRPGPDHYPGTIGVKNGWTIKAKATFVGAAKRHGHTIIVAMMHSKPAFWQDARKLLNWGFAARGAVRPVGTLVDPAPSPRPAQSPAQSPGPRTTPPADAPSADASVTRTAAPAPGSEAAASGGRPLFAVAVGALAGLGAAVLVSAGTFVLVFKRRRRAAGRKGT